MSEQEQKQEKIIGLKCPECAGTDIIKVRQYSETIEDYYEFDLEKQDFDTEYYDTETFGGGIFEPDTILYRCDNYQCEHESEDLEDFIVRSEEK